MRHGTRLLMAVAIGTLGALAPIAPVGAQAPAPRSWPVGSPSSGRPADAAATPSPRQPVNAGGRRYDGPFGTVYASNITPDRETGIGAWTDEQIMTAIRLGRRPNGDRILPVHPYTVFNGMAEGDLSALTAYLRTLPPVKRANQPKRITVPLFESVFLPAWLAAFAPKETPPPSAPTRGWHAASTSCGRWATAASATRPAP